MSFKTLKLIIGPVVAPINDITGVTDTPVNPKEALANVACPETPSPPVTCNAPVKGLVDAAPDVMEIPDAKSLSEFALNESKTSEETADPADC